MRNRPEVSNIANSFTSHAILRWEKGANVRTTDEIGEDRIYESKSYEISDS